MPDMTPEEMAEVGRRFGNKDNVVEAVVIRMDSVKPEPIRWLWPGRVALGKVTMIAGDPGLGKSLLTTAMAAHVTRGSMWPVDGSPCPEGDVVMLSAEDDAADTIRPRLDAAGATVSRVHMLTLVREYSGDGIEEHCFSLERDLAPLNGLLDTLPECKLVTIDPISAYLGGVDSYKNADIRALLTPLATLASKHGIAIVVVTHLNKSSQSNAMYRASGSLAFVAAARAVFAVTKCQEDTARRLILPIKNNIGKDTSGLAYRVGTADNDAPVVEWEPDPVEIDVEEAMGPEDSDAKSEREDAADWLQDTLSSGPVLTTELQKLAKEAGHSWRTVSRAKKIVGAESRKQDFSSKWTWCIPPKDATEPQECQSNTLATLGNVGALGEDLASDYQRVKDGE